MKVPINMAAKLSVKIIGNWHAGKTAKDSSES
jgi:hypothetical protein